ncbi:MAG TPA: tRNA 4-thiouridine(8) synthase ThiI [Candidatus Fimivivens faecavium]|nr:tRNA 4-thiouridine(8) synthase ThiI [Candidatus Fimivivens faecavium]
MDEIILLKYGEIALKGQNRNTFENLFIRNLRRRLRGLGEFKIEKAQSTVTVAPAGQADMDEAFERLSKVFGAAAISRSAVVGKTYEQIREAVSYLDAKLQSAKTFKVEAKRSDKAFPMNSPELCRELGHDILERYPHLSVDVHRPDLTVWVEVRDRAAYLHVGQLPGAGGIPVGSGGRAALLLSGGIDSPVAGYLMAKRGLEINAVHFASPPYTSERAKLKVIKLCQLLVPYTGWIHLTVVPFTKIQDEIARRCPEEFFTIIMRRFMMEIASRIGAARECAALVTGESLGQVASQTVQGIACTDAAAALPVLRPAIGMDKDEIVAVARKIGTFETSILPYEDCCTVFTPRHPKTKPHLPFVLEAERALDREALMAEAIAGAEAMLIDDNTEC